MLQPFNGRNVINVLILVYRSFAFCLWLYHKDVYQGCVIKLRIFWQAVSNCLMYFYVIWFFPLKLCIWNASLLIRAAILCQVLSVAWHCIMCITSISLYTCLLIAPSFLPVSFMPQAILPWALSSSLLGHNMKKIDTFQFINDIFLLQKSMIEWSINMELN